MPSGSSSSGLSRTQWEFDAGHGAWQPYADDSQRELEANYREWESSGRNAQKRSLQIAFASHPYTVDFEARSQTNRTTGKVRKIRRIERPLDSVTNRLRDDVHNLETQLAETQHENRRLRRSLTAEDMRNAQDRQPLPISDLAIFQDRLRVYRLRERVPCFSLPSDSALRRPDLPSGKLVLAVCQHTSIANGIRRLWLELACGGFIHESLSYLEPCEGESMEEQCELLVSSLRAGRPAETTACICPAEGSPLSTQRDYVARVGYSCLSAHGETSVVVKQLLRSSPEFEFVHRAFQAKLVSHRVHYNSDEMADPPKLEVKEILRIFNPVLIQRYDDERRSITLRDVSVPEQGNAAPDAEYVFESSNLGLQPSSQEFFLWHGTRPEVVERIEHDGFDPRRGGTSVGKLFGVGTYLAEHASKSDLYGDGSPKSNARGQVHVVLFVKALLGRTYYTKVAMQEATKPPDDEHGKPFDSVTALTRAESGCVDLREYIVYKPAQVLPLCRVVYQHLPECKCCRCLR